MRQVVGMQGPCDFITLCEIQQRQPACGAAAEGVSCRVGPCSRCPGAESCLRGSGTYRSLAIPSIAAGTQSARQAFPSHSTEPPTGAIMPVQDCSPRILVNGMDVFAASPEWTVGLESLANVANCRYQGCRASSPTT